ncbi:hypothetical protein PROFUN_14480 [Planoprotostelium fungivorum]|uniref:Uncharacterized protein n=1 Tax=Planoprotostelium fungivorum TaxID=1890364 RepID=A0A2P6MZY6_9EUKA|nr:hypothetical protein PROFUN_14480 [Planoprotostelium fungivorum]
MTYLSSAQSQVNHHDKVILSFRVVDDPQRATEVEMALPISYNTSLSDLVLCAVCINHLLKDRSHVQIEELFSFGMLAVASGAGVFRFAGVEVIRPLHAFASDYSSIASILLFGISLSRTKSPVTKYFIHAFVAVVALFCPSLPTIFLDQIATVTNLVGVSLILRACYYQYKRNTTAVKTILLGLTSTIIGSLMGSSGSVWIIPRVDLLHYFVAFGMYNMGNGLTTLV